MKLRGLDIDVLKAGAGERDAAAVVVWQKSGAGRAGAVSYERGRGPRARCARVFRIGLRSRSPADSERQLRRGFAKVLQVSRRLGLERIDVTGPDAGASGLSDEPAAKIMAQEILRFLREDTGNLKGVFFVLKSSRSLRAYQKGVLRYLGHLSQKLFESPFLMADTVIETGGGVVLVRRKNPPYGWALPGGFLDAHETLEETALREAKEETGLSVKNLRQMRTYSRPSRDPRFPSVSAVFVGQAKGKPRASSDAACAGVFEPREWRRLPLAFDHRRVLEDYLKWKESR
jgi:8-oxo-dGTP diphosphatase